LLTGLKTAAQMLPRREPFVSGFFTCVD
jgi:hypothetical protein